MQLRRLDLLCLISFTCFVLTVALVGLSFEITPWDHRISFTHSFHVGVWDARIVFFNDADYGPYSGSIISLGGSDAEGNFIIIGRIRAHALDRIWSLWGYGFRKTCYANSGGTVIGADTFCDLPGIYYRHFTRPEWALWTLKGSLGYPAIIFSVLPLIWSARRLKRRHRPAPPHAGEPLPTPSDR